MWAGWAQQKLLNKKILRMDRVKGATYLNGINQFMTTEF
jgi:hypothetical protein